MVVRTVLMAGTLLADVMFCHDALLMSCMPAENALVAQAGSNGPYPVTLLLPAGVSTSFTITAPIQKQTVALLPSGSPQVGPPIITRNSLVVICPLRPSC